MKKEIIKPVSTLLIYLILVFTSCNKNKNQHPVPSFPFDVTINVELPSYSNLTGVGGWAYVYTGNRNVIVYRKEINNFIAFDRQSPKDIDNNCPQPLTPDNDNFLQLIDSCNNAIFSLYDGQPISNSDYGLRQYQTVWDGQNKLRIFN